MEFSGTACGVKTELTFLIVGDDNQASAIEGTCRGWKRIYAAGGSPPVWLKVLFTIFHSLSISASVK